MSLTVEKCLQAWTNSFKQMGTIADVVFFGDSLTFYGDFSQVFPGKVVCNLGLRGDTIEGMIDRVEQVKILSPKAVFLMAGINNVSLFGGDAFGDIYDSLLTKMRIELHDTTVFIQTLLPVNDRDFSISCNNEQIVSCNASIKRVANKNNMASIDLFSLFEQDGYLPKAKTFDGIHLYEKSYLSWYNRLKKYNNFI